MNISKTISDMIYESGHSQREIARMVGVTETSVSRYCKGARKPTVETFVKIAEACGYSVNVSRPTEDKRFALRVFKRGLEDTLSADDTRRYMDTVISALSE